MVDCPYCQKSDEECKHLMLVVDTTFRSVVGGHLYSLALKRLGQMFDDEALEDESERFLEFLEEISSITTAESEYEVDGGPGNCSGYINYYCEDEKTATTAYLKLLQCV